MIKVKYNSETTLVEGYYPDSVNYINNIIDEEAKTIDGSPYVDIDEETHQSNIGKTMCVIGEMFQEYVKTDDEILEEARKSKIGICKAYLTSKDWLASREVSEPGSFTQTDKDLVIAARTAINALEAASNEVDIDNIDVTQFNI